MVSINVFASTNTYTRTNDNLLVPEDVTVTSNNINDILKTPAVFSSEKIYDFADLYTDNEETAKARFETYFRETAPLIDYYKNKNVLSSINADGSIEEEISIQIGREKVL